MNQESQVAKVSEKVPEKVWEKRWSADLQSIRSLRSIRAGVTELMSSSVHFVSVVTEKVRDDALSLRAMGLTYVTLLSLAPLLAVMFAVLTAFGIQNQIEPVLAQWLEPLGQRGVEITQQVIGFVDNLRVGVLGAVGIATLFYTVVSLISKIEDSLNYIWQVRHSRSWPKKFSDYLSVVLVGPVLVFSSLTVIASAQSNTVVQYLVTNELLGPLVVVAARLMPFAFLCIAFTFLYKFVPNTRVPFGSALIGGAVTAILWQLAGMGFAAFVASSTRYAAIYSSFAILVFFFIWLYASWLIILIGAQVAYFHQYPSLYRAGQELDAKTPLSRERLLLTALVAITRRYLSEQTPWSLPDLAKGIKVQLSALEELADTLMTKGLLLRTVEPDGIVLGRPPEKIALVEILDTLRSTSVGNTTPPRQDAISALLQHRDQAVSQALDGMTLRSLATENSAVAEFSVAKSS